MLSTVTIKNTIRRILPYKVYAPVRDALCYIHSFKYCGEQYVCPFCNGRFSTFLSTGYRVNVLTEKAIIGAGYRNNAKCPRCNSVDRERLVYQYLRVYKVGVFSRNTRLLHVAPEKNLSAKLKSCPNMDYLSVDLDSPLADVQMDITDIIYDDESFDVIICNHVLEHIPDDAKAMRELLRVLKKGGFAILQVPISWTIGPTFEDFSITSPEQREQSFGQKDHVRIYGNDYSQRLKNAGFDVRLHSVQDLFEENEIDRFRLLKDETIFECVRP